MDVLYTAEATAWGGREGRVASSDGVLDVQLAIPKAMGGPGGPLTNPEQLFATGYAACFHSALKLVAARDKIDVTDSAITARVGIGIEGAAFTLQVTLEGELPGVERAQAEELLAKAHEVCPYSNATRGNIAVDLVVIES